MENYLIEQLLKAFDEYWAKEEEYSDAVDEFFGYIKGGQEMKGTALTNPLVGLEKTRRIKAEMEIKRDKLREREEEIARLFKNRR